MKLYEYLKLFKSACWDIPDNEIDYSITIDWDSEYKYDDTDFPNMDLFILTLLKKVDIDYCMEDGCPVLKLTDLILSNKELCLNFALRNWENAYFEAVKNDDVELCYQFIKEFDNVAGGRYGETMNKKYYNLLKRFKAIKGLSLN